MYFKKSGRSVFPDATRQEGLRYKKLTFVPFLCQDKRSSFRPFVQKYFPHVLRYGILNTYLCRKFKSNKMTSNVNVSLTDEIRLETALKYAGVKRPASVVKLAVSGNFTDDDFRFIREKMAKPLQELDMGGTKHFEMVKVYDALAGCKNLTFPIPIPHSFFGGNSYEVFVLRLKCRIPLVFD